MLASAEQKSLPVPKRWIHPLPRLPSASVGTSRSEQAKNFPTPARSKSGLFPSRKENQDEPRKGMAVLSENEKSESSRKAFAAIPAAGQKRGRPPGHRGPPFGRVR